MSKDAPEIGDVFENKFKKRMFIYYADKVTTSFYVKIRNVIKKNIRFLPKNLRKLLPISARAMLP